MNNIANINNDYSHPIMSLSESVLNDLYCKEFGDNSFCSFQLPKFPSKKFKDKNFNYILKDIIQKSGQAVRQNTQKEQILA